MKRLTILSLVILLAGSSFAGYGHGYFVASTVVDTMSQNVEAVLDSVENANTCMGRSVSVAASDSWDKTKADYVCDGTSDEVQINAALIACAGGPGISQETVILLPGTYYLHGRIIVKNQAALEGYGATLICMSDTMGAVIDVDLALSGSRGGRIAGMRIIGYNRPTSYALRVRSCPRGTEFSDILIDVAKYGILEESLLGGNFFSNVRSFCTFNSLVCSGAPRDKFVGCYFESTDSTAVVVDGCSGVSITGNTIVCSEDSLFVVRLDGSGGCSISGNVIIGKSRGVYLTGDSDFNSVSANTISATTDGNVSPINLGSGTNENVVGPNAVKNDNEPVEDNGTDNYVLVLGAE